MLCAHYIDDYCSKHAKSIVPYATGERGESSTGVDLAELTSKAADLPAASVEAVTTAADRELVALKASLAGTELVGALASCCRTLDQAKALLTFAGA